MDVEHHLPSIVSLCTGALKELLFGRHDVHAFEVEGQVDQTPVLATYLFRAIFSPNY